MSTEVDQRIVELKFDNQNFEKNVSTSMKTLKKFKESLKFEGATKGIEKVNEEASRFSMSKMEEAAEKVEMKISAMSVVAISAISRIVEKAVDAGIKIVKSLSTDNIIAGWNKLEDKTASVQTIMNATGKSIDDVNGYLDKLMWFSDETSYSFNEMTRAIAQMTSSGGDINKLIPMVQGVANATAYAGKNAEEFSRVMYNLNQSYGAGYLTYMDWRSVELAGVASKELKQTFIDVAKQLGKIKDDEVTIANFSQTLKDKWADTEVMETAFGYFAEMSDLAFKMVQSGEVDTAAEAYEILSERYDTVSLTAAKAAQEAKTFSEVMEYTKDAVGSGWMRTFELIFGNYNEAKKLYTDLAEEFYKLFVVGGEKRNEALSKGLLGGMEQLRGEGVVDLELFKEYLLDAAKAAGTLDRETSNLAQTDFSESLKRGWVSTEVLTTALRKAVTEYNVYDDATLKAKGYTQDQIIAMSVLSDTVLSGKMNYEEYAEMLGRSSGHENLTDAFWNLWHAIFEVNEESGKAIGVFAVVKEAFDEVFPSITGDRIYDITVKLKEFTEKLRLSEDQATNLKNVFTTLFTPIKAFGNIIIKGAKFVGSLLGKVIKLAGSFASLLKNLKPTDNILEKLFGKSNSLKILQKWKTATSHLKEEFGRVGERIREMWSNFKGSEKAQAVLKKLGDALATVATWVSDKIIIALDWISKLDLSSILVTVVNGFSVVIGYIKEAYTWVKEMISGMSWNSVTDWIANVKKLVSGLVEKLKIKIDNTWLSDFIEKIKELGEKAPEFLNKAKDAILEFAKSLTPGRILIFAFSILLVSMISNINKLLGSVTTLVDNLGSIAKVIKNKIVKPTPLIQLAAALTVLTAALVILSKQKPEELDKAIKVLVGGLVALIGALVIITKISDKLVKNDKAQIALVAISNTLLRLGSALLMIAGAFWIIGQVDTNNIIKQLGSFAVLLSEFVVVCFALGKITLPLGKGARVLIAVAASMMILAKAMKVISNMDPINIVDTLTKIIPAIIALLGIAVVGRLSGGAGRALGITIMIANILLIVRAIEKLKEVNVKDLLSVVPQYILLMIAMKMLASTLWMVGDNGAAKAGLGMLAMAGAIVIIAYAMKQFKELKRDEATQALNTISIIMMLFMGILAVSKLSEGQSYGKMGASFIALAVAVGLLVLVIKAFGNMTSAELDQGLTAVGILMAMFALVIAVSKNANKAAGIILSMAIAVGILTGAIAILGMGMDWKEIATAVGGLSAIMLALAGSVKIINSVADVSLNALKIDALAATFIEMAGMLAIIVIAIRNLPKDIGREQMAAFGAGISALMLGMSAVIFVLNKFPPVDKDAIGRSLLEFAGVMAIIGVLGGAILWLYGQKFMQDAIGDPEKLSAIQDALLTLVQLAVATTVLTGALAVIGKAGGKQISAGVLGLLEVMGVVSVLGAGIMLLYGQSFMQAIIGDKGVLTSIQNALLMIAQLAYYVTPLVAIMALIGSLVPSVGAVSVGALALLEILGVIAIVGAGIVALTAAFESLGLIDKAMDGIVRFATGFKIAAIQLQSVAAVFNDFASVDASGVDNFMAIFEALQHLAQANLIDNIADLFGKNMTLADVGQAFSDFIPSLKDIANQLKGVELSGIGQAASALKDFGSFMEALPREDGIVNTILGNRQSLKEFAEGVPDLALAIRTIITSFPEQIDTGKIQAIKKAGEILVALQEALPKTGGVVQWWEGEAGDLSKFADGIQAFGEAMVIMQETLTKVDKTTGEQFQFDEGLISSVAGAGKLLAELNNALPETGGKLQEWLGKKDLAEWGSKLPLLANGLVGFQKSITREGFTFDAQQVKSAANAAEALATLNSKLPSTGGKLQAWLTGEKELDLFATNIEALGRGLYKFNVYAVNLDQDSINKAITLVNGIVEIANQLDPAGGMKDWFDGSKENALGQFGANLKYLGINIGTFADSITNVEWDGVDRAVIVIQRMVSAARTLGTFDGASFNTMVGAFALLGTNGLDGFVDAFQNADADAKIQQAAEHLINGICNQMRAYMNPELEDVADLTVGIFGIYFNASIAQRSEGIAKTFIATIASGIRTEALGDQLQSAGEFVVAGIQAGINTAWGGLEAAMRDKAESIALTFQYSLEIHSPSKVMRDEVGKYIVEGIAEGITENMSAEEAAKKKAENIVNAFKDAISKIETEIKSAQLEFELWNVSTIHESKSERLDKQLISLSKEVKLGRKKLDDESAKFKAIAMEFEEGSDQYAEAANNYAQAKIDFNKVQQSYYDALANMEAPSVQFNEAGKTIIKGIINGITSDMTAEEVAAKKAENIVAAFQDVFDTFDMRSSILDIESNIWDIMNPKANDFDTMVHEILKNREELQIQAERYRTAEAQAEAMMLKDPLQELDATKNAVAAQREEYEKLAELAAYEYNIANSTDAEVVKNYMNAVNAIDHMTEEQLRDWNKISDDNPILKKVNEVLDTIPKIESSDISFVGEELFEGLKDESNLSHIGEDLIVEFKQAAEQITSSGEWSAAWTEVGEDAGEQAANGFMTSLMGQIFTLTDDVNLGNMTGIGSKISGLFGQVSTAFSNGEITSDIADKARAAISSFSSDVTGIIRGTKDSVEGLANDYAEGYGQGLFSSKEPRKGGEHVAEEALSGTADAQKSKSPSKEAEALGEFYVIGFCNGLMKMLYMVRNGGEAVANEALDSVENIVTKIDQVLQGDFDFAPSISPVLDLSGVYTTASQLGMNLDTSGSFDLASHAFTEVEAVRQAHEEAMTQALIDSIGTRIDALNGGLDEVRDILDAHGKNDLIINVDVDGAKLAQMTIEDYILASAANGTPFYEGGAFGW